ncbi:MAG: GDP-L-fucose synthase [Oligoflexia bacterium]|nr:GDP-L-fucose synthase [Oligoflexia bacterium]
MNNIKIYIAGHTGLVGSAIYRQLIKEGFSDSNIITTNRNTVDLTNTEDVNKFFERERPDWVFAAAAKVGGIHANSTYPVNFLLENLKIQNNLIECSYKYSVKKLLFLGSSCVYPKLAPQPIKEEYLLTSSLEPSNQWYALAKITGIKLCNAYNLQYKCNFISVMPCNLYGPNDNYHELDSHVLPALIRRMHFAKENKDKKIVIWGSGNPKREFLFSDDLAAACVMLMKNYDAKDIGDLINIGSSSDITIKEVVDMLMNVVGYRGEIIFDSSKPDGTPRKIVDSSKIKKLGWEPSTALYDGLKISYNDFLEKLNQGILRGQN